VLATLKRALLDDFPRVKSTHLSEALAFGLGYRTHASLKADLARPEAERPTMSLDLGRLRERLLELGYHDDEAVERSQTSMADQSPALLGSDSAATMRAALAVGFDSLNLAAAVDAVMASAAKKDQDVTFSMYTAKRIDLRDPDQVRMHLMDAVRRHYEQAKQRPGGVRIASIERVVYSPVGFVFEQNMGEMHPPPIGADMESRVTHLAYFWSVL